MKATNKFFRSSFLLKVFFTMLTLSLFCTEQLSAQCKEDFKNKLQNIVDQGRQIRDVFRSIVNKVGCLSLSERLRFRLGQMEGKFEILEQKKDDLADHLDGLELPFPDKITRPGQRVIIGNKAIRFSGLNINIPERDRKLPCIGDFFVNFLDRIDMLESDVLYKVTEIDNELAEAINNCNQTNSYYQEYSGSFPEAKYLDCEFARAA